MELMSDQYARIAPLFPKPCGTVGLSNLQVPDVILYVNSFLARLIGLSGLSRVRENWNSPGLPAFDIRTVCLRISDGTALPGRRIWSRPLFFWVGLS